MLDKYVRRAMPLQSYIHLKQLEECLMYASLSLMSAQQELVEPASLIAGSSSFV